VSDPTYVKSQIEDNPEWYLAWTLSEIQNDQAPIGWSKYIWIAKCLMASDVWKVRTTMKDSQ
jgi:hypothetical protein